MPTVYTVARDALLREAESIERDANQSLNAWILLGKTEAYGEALKVARTLRVAADEKSIWLRRELLRCIGYTVLTPRAASTVRAA